MSPNPFTTLRLATGMSAADFASFSGVSYVALWAAERGLPADPRRLIAGLATLGYDTVALTSDYATWRKANQEQLRAAAR